MLLSIEELFKKGHTYVGVHRVDTILLVQFALVHLKI